MRREEIERKRAKKRRGERTGEVEEWKKRERVRRQRKNGDGWVDGRM